MSRTIDYDARAVWRLTWPQIVTMLFHFSIGFLDSLTAGRVGPSAQAAVGVGAQALFFFLTLAMALAAGASAAVGQSLGAERRRRAGRFARLAVGVAGLGSLAVSLAGILWLDALVGLLRPPPGTEAETAEVLRVFLFSLPANGLFVAANAVFRAAGRVALPLWGTLAVAVVNGLLDFGLGLGFFGLPRLGARGIAFSTLAATLAGAVFVLVCLRRMDFVASAGFPDLRWTRRVGGYLLKTSWPAGAMQFIWQSAYLVLYAVLAALPAHAIPAVAALSAGLRVESIVFLPAFAFNMTAAILTGRLLGAGDFPSAKRAARNLWLIGTVGLSLFAALLWPHAERLAAFIAPDPEVSREVVSYLRYNLAGIPLTVTTMTLGGAFVGAGATMYNLAVFSLAAWCVRLPLAWLLGHAAQWGALGVWRAMLASMLVQAICMVWLFERGGWARFAMRGQQGAKLLRGAS